jgi:hypothetical protein
MKKHSILRLLTTLVVALLLVSVFSEVADAQRRRRRRRRRHRPARTTAPAQPPADADAGVEAPPEAESTTPAAAPDAATPEPTAETSGESAPAESSSLAAAPAPEAAPEPAAEPEPDFVDLGPIREEFTAVMDDLVQVRSRIAVLGRQLFQTKVRVRVQDRADDQDLVSIALRLDGAPIFRGDPSSVNDDVQQVFDGFAAPGPHVLTVETEQRARADDDYRYTQSDTYRFMVVRGKATELTLVLDDSSDIAEDFPDDGEGEYDIRVRLRVATRELSREP